MSAQARVIPLLTPHKMGRFNLSHRYGGYHLDMGTNIVSNYGLLDGYYSHNTVLL